MSLTISATIDIAATPERVWTVLADLASYPRWHPVFTQASGQLSVGNWVTLTTTQPVTGRTMKVKVKVAAVEPPTELRWTSSVLGMTISRRSFTLSPADGGTELTQTGIYTQGIYSRFPPKTINRIQVSFDTINDALKAQAEAASR